MDLFRCGNGNFPKQKQTAISFFVFKIKISFSFCQPLQGMEDTQLNNLIQKCIEPANTLGNKYCAMSTDWCVALYMMTGLATKSERLSRYFELMNQLPVTCDYLVFPIVCEYQRNLLEKEHFVYKTDYTKNVLRHYIVCIVDMANQRLDMFDSMKNRRLMQWWGLQLEGVLRMRYQWTKESSDVCTFVNSDCIHQNGSINCGLFVTLYVHMHIQGATLKQIDDDTECNESLAWAMNKILDEYYQDVK